MASVLSHKQRDFDRALSDSADLFGDIFSDIEPPPITDDFLVVELGRLLEEGASSFRDEDFRFLIQQGIRLEYNDDLHLRSRLAERLLCSASVLEPKARRILPHVIGALEDTDFPLQRIGVVVRYYTDQLFRRLEAAEPQRTDTGATRAIEAVSKDEQTDEAIVALLQTCSPPSLAELLFEAVDNAVVASAAIDALERSAVDTADGGNTGIRALAYAVSEPMLDEALEAKALEALLRTWPKTRTYILYNLRMHSHEDIPFRWLELLVRSGELRAVDRILEEVLFHASSADYREDLMAALDLVASSPDPGREGKLLRLLRGPTVPEEVRTFITDWTTGSPHASFLDEAGVPEAGTLDFVHIGEDFSRFATRLGNVSLEEVCRRWRAAYHESLGWLQLQRLPRSELEIEYEAEVEREVVRQFSSGTRPEEATLRSLVDGIRNPISATGELEVERIVAIYRKRPLENPWLVDIYMRELNRQYIRAAQSYEEGNARMARRELDVLLAIEPNYPFAVMLNSVLDRK